MVKKREYIGVTFQCCHVYTRIYINKKRNAFVGWCPRCGVKMEVFISTEGSDSKFFTAK